MQDLKETQKSAIAIVENILGVAELLGVPVHRAQVVAIEEVAKVTGIDYSGLLKYSPAQAEADEEAVSIYLTPSQLAGKMGLSAGTTANTLLADLGLQVKDGGQWEATEKGNGLCCRHSWSKGGKSGYNLKWNLKKVLELAKK